MTSLRLYTALLLGLLLAAFMCNSCTERLRQDLYLEGFTPNQGVEVALNQTLVLIFSEDLDPRSVTRQSVRVLDEQGEPVGGSFEPNGRRLKFVPRLPRSKLLLDGSFLPGTTYTVELVGFPRPDAVRGYSGAMLAHTFRTSFQTVAFGSGTPLFDGSTREDVPLLVPRSQYIAPGEGIVLECSRGLNPTTLEQSLDPSRVSEWAFELRGGDQKPIPLRIELIENRDDFAVLQLRPVDRLNSRVTRALEAGTYGLVWREVERGPATLGGMRVPASWFGAYRVEVVAPTEKRVTESFDDVSRRSFAMREGVDGTALWSGDGSVRVRFPRAAGDGHDGRKRLAGQVTVHDVEATQIEVREGTVATLPSEGLVVLSSQRSIDINGRLVRRVERGAAARGDSENHSSWLRRTARRTVEWDTPHMFSLADSGTVPTKTLTEFIAAARESNEAWTILIAGGDLRVRGEIDVDGPLLIVTGGWLRVDPGQVEARRVWVLPGDSGGGDIHPPVSDVAPLVFDELQFGDPNPLATSLSYGVLSKIVSLDQVLSWRDPTVESTPARSPNVHVHLFVVNPETHVEFGPVTNSALLIQQRELRFLVELEVSHLTPMWEPPSLQQIMFHWTTTAGHTR